MVQKRPKKMKKAVLKLIFTNKKKKKNKFGKDTSVKMPLPWQRQVLDNIYNK